jgi:hypothetical protein
LIASFTCVEFIMAIEAIGYTILFIYLFILKFLLFYYMCIQCLGHFFPLPPPPPLPSTPPPPSIPTPSIPAETILPLPLILLKREYKQ